MSTPVPTVGRNVWITARTLAGVMITLPALISHVHSDECISAVAVSGLSDVEGLLAGGTLPLSSISYDDSGEKLHSWRWMPFQKGQAAKTDQTVEQVHKSLQEQLHKAEDTLAKQLLEAVANATSPLVEKIAALSAQLIALNQRQPASQRVDVADPSLKTDAVGGPDASAPKTSDAQPPAGG